MERLEPLRLVLGCAQMFGACLGLVMLASSGLTPAAIGVALGTTALTLVSRRLFARRR
jgi:hypothetical protein